jgi:hypothetical protein
MAARAVSSMAPSRRRSRTTAARDEAYDGVQGVRIVALRLARPNRNHRRRPHAGRWNQTHPVPRMSNVTDARRPADDRLGGLPPSPDFWHRSPSLDRQDFQKGQEIFGAESCETRLADGPVQSVD